MKELKLLKHLIKGNTKSPIFEPILKNLDFETRVTERQGELNDTRQSRRRNIDEDIEHQPFLRRMDIIGDVREAFQATDFLDEFWFEKSNVYVETIQDMIKIVDEKYVLKSEFDDLLAQLEEMTKQMNTIQVQSENENVDLPQEVEDLFIKFKSQVSDLLREKRMNRKSLAKLWRSYTLSINILPWDNVKKNVLKRLIHKERMMQLAELEKQDVVEISESEE